VKQHGRRRKRTWRGNSISCKLQDTLHRRKYTVVHTASSTPLFTFKFQLHASRLMPHASHPTPHASSPPPTLRCSSNHTQTLPMAKPPLSARQSAAAAHAPVAAPRNCSKLHLPALACAHLAVDQSTLPSVRHFVRLRKIHPPFSPQRIRRIVSSLVPYPGPGAPYPSSRPIHPHLTHDPGQKTGDPPGPPPQLANELWPGQRRKLGPPIRPPMISDQHCALAWDSGSGALALCSFPAPQ
jgi:hypothetical protein